MMGGGTMPYQFLRRGTIMGTAALVLGIIALVIAVCGGFAGLGWLGSITAIIAIILGAIAKKDPNQKGAKAGLIMGIIALSYGIVATVACLACIGAAAEAAYYL